MDWIEYMLPTAINSVLMALKNEKTRQTYRKAFLKIYRGIKLAFAGDPDFE